MIKPASNSDTKTKSKITNSDPCKPTGSELLSVAERWSSRLLVQMPPRTDVLDFFVT